MTPEQVLKVSESRAQAAEELIAAFLFAVSEVASTESVRKTTLAALLDAAEESEVAIEGLLDTIARANLTDALLSMRERGVVLLTDEGFSLAEHQPPSIWDSLSEWLTVLVRRKLSEWQLLPSTAQPVT